MKYTLIRNSEEIVAESNNKAELIKMAKQMQDRATIIDYRYSIIFENDKQIEKNNERSKTMKPTRFQVDYSFYGNGEMKWDTFNNNGKGYTIKEAKEIKQQLSQNGHLTEIHILRSED